MSAGYATIQAFARRREEEAADPYFDEELAEAAVRLLAGGDVSFKLSTRVSGRLLPAWRIALYAFFRRHLPAKFRGAPQPAMQRGIYDHWKEAVRACQTPDDQLLVMPRNRSYEADKWDVAVECRPCDPEDAQRFLTLKCVFGCSLPVEQRRTYLARLEEEIHSSAERLLTKCHRA